MRDEERFRKMLELLRLLTPNQTEANTLEMSLGDIATMPIVADSLCDEMLALKKQTWQQLQHARIVAEAIFICGMFGRAPPPWLISAAFEAIEKLAPAEESHRRHELLLHVVRWFAV